MFKHNIMYLVIQMKIKEDIEKLREELYKSIENNGLNAEETMKISKELDKKIQKYLKDIEHIIDKKENRYNVSYKKLKKLTKDFGEFPTVKGWNKYAKENNLLSSSSIEYISGLNWNKLRTKILSEI